MKRKTAIQAVLDVITTTELAIVTARAIKKDPNNYSLKLLEATLKNPNDPNDNWFTALAILCISFPALAESMIEETIVLSGKPKKKKKEIIKTVIYAGMPAKIEAG
jgi:hypothetical protein